MAEHLTEIIYQRSSGDYVFHWQEIGDTRKKYLVVSISLPQLHWVFELTTEFKVT